MIATNYFLDFNSYRLKTNPKKSNKMDIYYYNDTHGNSDQMMGIMEAAKNFQKKQLTSDCVSFTLSGGDTPSGADKDKNGFMYDLVKNYMKVDYSAVGNHECDPGGKDFYETVKDKNLNFIATNVKFDDNNPMNKLVKKSDIAIKNGVKTGFIGTMPLDLKTVLREDSAEGIEVMNLDDTIKALQDEIDNLKSQGVNRIVMLSHVGYDLDKELAQKLDGVDIIIGGHTHNVVDGAIEGENLVKSKSGEPVIITQAGENARYYGLLNVEFDDNGVLTKINNTLKPSTNMNKSAIIEEIKAQEIGISPTVGNIIEIEPLPENRRIAPCAWTALMADAVKSELGTEISLINSANIRKVPQIGSVTERDITESAPMKNTLLRTKVTQRQLVEGIKAAAKQTFSSQDGYPGLIQGSGFTYKVNDLGEILEMNFVDKNGKISPIDINNPSEDITYTASYDTFFARADGETPEFAPKFETEQFDFDKDKATVDYISKLPNKDKLRITDDKRLEVIPTGQTRQLSSSNRKI